MRNLFCQLFGGNLRIDTQPVINDAKASAADENKFLQSCFVCGWIKVHGNQFLGKNALNVPLQADIPVA